MNKSEMLTTYLPYRLFLDDKRMPCEAGNYMLPADLRKEYNSYEWVIVKNYPEFTECIKENGIPTHVSFDHDLAVNHYYTSFMDSDSIQYEDYREFEDDYNKTGYHCAKWLIDFCIDNKVNLPEYYIHSMNPVGRDNIKSLLQCFQKTYK